MIEVEKKFQLNSADITRLTQGAEFISKKKFADIYYDTTDYQLTSKDIWLRERDGQLELKIPLHVGMNRQADQYDEIEDENEIAKRLRLPVSEDLKKALAKNGYQPCCTCTTTRQKYKRNSFTIDLDLVDYGDFTYSVGEIELMVNDQSAVDEAVSKILDFARQNQLAIDQIRGKVVEYLKQQRPCHYQTLLKEGVVAEF